MSNNPENLTKLLHLIYRNWKKYPTLRLMQFLHNCFEDNTESKMYYCSDEELEKKIKETYGDTIPTR